MRKLHFNFYLLFNFPSLVLGSDGKNIDIFICKKFDLFLKYSYLDIKSIKVYKKAVR